MVDASAGPGDQGAAGELDGEALAASIGAATVGLGFVQPPAVADSASARPATRPSTAARVRRRRVLFEVAGVEVMLRRG